MASCAVCSSEFRGRQLKIPCLSCHRVVHRRCVTGVSQEVIVDLWEANEPIIFFCPNCAPVQLVASLSTSLLPAPPSPPGTPDDRPLPPPPSFMDQSVNFDEAFCESSAGSCVEQSPSGPTWRIELAASAQNCPLLTDGMGFRYSKKSESKKSFIWRCTSRSPRGRFGVCKATAKQIKRSADYLTVFDQRDFTFTAHSPYETHCHPAVDGILSQELICIYRDSKQAALIDTSKSASQIVDEVVNKYSAQSLVNKNSLKRVICNQRNKRKRQESAEPRPQFCEALIN